jgi:aspartate carbamoyltransferase catalytic subunit
LPGRLASKGESLLDTIANLQRHGTDVPVVRHSDQARPPDCPHRRRMHVINAVTAACPPDAGLLDVFMIRHYKRLQI